MNKKQGNSVGNVAITYCSSLCALGISAAFPSSLSHAAVPTVINGVALTALIDSCSYESFIHEQVANRLKLTLSPSTRNISMALNSLVSTGDTGRQPPLLPPQLAAIRADTIIHNYRLSMPP